MLEAAVVGWPDEDTLIKPKAFVVLKSPDKADDALAQALKEFVTIEQVASLALFLCSENAAQITGANLSIDGGWTAE